MRMNMKRLPFVLLIVGLAFGLASLSQGAEAVQPIVIDVRTVEEWNTGHLEGAILIPYEEIGDKIGPFVKDKSERIYVYCRSGRRAQIAKETLEKMGYKDVVNLGNLEDAAKALKKIVKYGIYPAKSDRF